MAVLPNCPTTDTSVIVQSVTLIPEVTAKWTWLVDAVVSCELCLCLVRASDKRITCDEEFSDSEDEGDGGRRHQESFKHKRIRLDDKTDGKTAPADKSVY